MRRRVGVGSSCGTRCSGLRRRLPPVQHMRYTTVSLPISELTDARYAAVLADVMAER